MSGQGGAGLPPDNWLAESFRYTCFSSGEVSIEDVPWWREVMGHPGDKLDLDRNTMIRLEQGSFEKGTLVLGMSGPRIDWVWKAREPEQEAQADNGIPVLGSFPAAVGRFVEAISAWFSTDTCPTANRVALGCVLLQPVADRMSGYRKLQPYLCRYLKIDEVGSSDLIYNINRRRPSRSGVEGLQLNRLMKWMVRVSRSVSVTLSLSGNEARRRQAVGPAHLECCLELDLNTAPDYAGELSPQQQRAVLNELREAALEIAEKGDIS